MRKLKDVAKIIRSKNSGPFELTLDVIFADDEMFEKASRSKIITKDRIAEIYGIDRDTIIDIIEYPVARAIKTTLVRPIASGALGERDVYGAQQHAPLMEMEVDL
ncbi:MAG: DUF4387 domain-containing protein [Lachnospiraceae bacterium]|nr:DUF4387 domain-containing protein [Lachnospiraceae bacterium]